MPVLNMMLAGLEGLMNTYLRLDPETISRLNKLSGKIIKMEVNDWPITFFLAPQIGGLQLFAEYHCEPDVTIAGKLFNLFRVGVSKGETDKLFTNQIEIRGDIELGENIRDILAQIDIDWEEQFSRIVGDVLAHQFHVKMNQTLTIGKQMAKSLRNNFSEYLFEEAKMLPSQQSVDELYAEIAILRDDVERAQARIKRLQERSAANGKKG